MKRNKNRIYVIGYGMKGNLSGLTIEAYRIIKNSTHIYCRVDCDPIFGQLKN